MVARSTDLPKRLKQDAILEVVFELRFAYDGVPEIFFGRFADHRYWKDFKPRKLPASDIPRQVLAMDPNLRSMPLMECVAPNGQSKLTIGGSAVALHQRAPYPGWPAFAPVVHRFVDTLFETAQGSTVTRVGLKYSNALSAAAHGIGSIADLDMQATIASDRLADEMNINFLSATTPDSRALVRIATRGFLQGKVPADTSVFVEVDVHTLKDFTASTPVAVKSWVDTAHQSEKQEFFRLFKQSTLDAWRAA